jgi:hypothetical protein
MADQILMFKKTEDNLTWAILGDTEEGEDFLNWDNEHPSKITLRIFSKNDNKLDALMSSLNGTVLANFDQQDWFDCLFHTVFWYDIDPMAMWYEEETPGVTIATGASGEWLPVLSTPTGMAPDPFYGNSNPKIDDTWEYFKFIDFDVTRSLSTSGMYMMMTGVLGLSHTGEGDPAKLASFLMKMDFRNIATCKLQKEVYYIDVVGGAREKSVDRLFAEEWNSAVVDGKVTPYNPDEYAEDKKATVVAIGTDPEDDDLKYITYSVKGAVNIDTVNAILDGNFGTAVAMHGNINDTPAALSTITGSVTWIEIAPNVWGATGVTFGSGPSQNILMLYSPTYDVYSIYKMNKSYNGDAIGDFNSGAFSKAVKDSSNTVIETTENYNVVRTGNKNVVLPTVELMTLAVAQNCGIDSWSYTNANFAFYTDAACSTDNTPEPVSTGPSGDFTYCYGFVGDYDAYLSDYEIGTTPEPEKTINRLYAEEWDAATVGTDKVHDYDESTEPTGSSFAISEKGSSVDVSGVKYVVINGHYYAYALVGDYDAFISEFNKHTCSSDPDPSGDSNDVDFGDSTFTADSKTGDTWTDSNGNVWTVDAKNTDSGNTYLVVNTTDSGEGYLGPVNKVMDSLITDGTASSGYYLPYGAHTCPTDNSLQYMTVANEHTDPVLVSSKDTELVKIEDGYVVVKEWDEGTGHTYSMSFNGVTHTKGKAQCAVKFDENSKSMVIMCNTQYGTISASQCSEMAPSALLLSGYTDLYTQTKAAAIKYMDLDEETLNSVVVYDTDEFTMYNLGSTSNPTYLQIYKKMPFDTVYTKKPTTLNNAWDCLGGITWNTLTSTQTDYWKTFLASGGTDWGAPAVGNRIALAIDNTTGKPKDTSFTGTMLFADIGQIYNGTVGSVHGCLGYAAKCKIISSTTDPNDSYLKTVVVQLRDGDDSATATTYTGPYVKFVMQQAYISNFDKPISLLSAEFSDTPF